MPPHRVTYQNSCNFEYLLIEIIQNNIGHFGLGSMGSQTYGNRFNHFQCHHIVWHIKIHEILSFSSIYNCKKYWPLWPRFHRLTNLWEPYLGLQCATISCNISKFIKFWDRTKKNNRKNIDNSGLGFISSRAYGNHIEDSTVPPYRVAYQNSRF